MTWKRQTREEQFSALFLPTEKAVSCCGVGAGAGGGSGAGRGMERLSPERLSLQREFKV